MDTVKKTGDLSLACWYVALVFIWTTISTGCATGFDPKPIESVPFRDRAQTQVEASIRVTAAVPSATESRDLFGVSLYKKRIQPVWLEIENSTHEMVAFMPVGLDHDYQSPIEVASLNRNRSARAKAEQYLFQNGVNLQVAPGDTRSGFMFTNLDEGTKSFNVDIFGENDAWYFTFFIQVPGLAIDHYAVDFESLYDEDQITDFEESASLIETLEQLPCCTTDKGGKNQGDPLNLVIIGETEDLFYAFIRAGWDETEVVTTASGFKTAMSFITGGQYRYSPISSLYLFGRRQDIGMQRIRDNIHKRNHFRLWLSPMTFRGKPVWIGQISRDIGVRFTWKTITTHKIDPDVDETREFLLENLAFNQVLEDFAYVRGVSLAPINQPRQNLTGDPYYTDGLRVVIWIPPGTVDMDDIGYEEWFDPEN
jgi:hypothetical protein